MTDYSEKVELEPSEKELARRTAVSGIRNVIDEDSMYRKRKAYEQEILRRQQEEHEYGVRIVEAQKAKETADRSSYEARSGGRWKLLKKPRQVLFADQKCEYCDVAVKYPLSGWNPNVMIAGYSDLTQSYDIDGGQDDQLNYTQRHHCNTSDPILDKKIEKLRKEFRQYQERAFDFFKHQPSL